MSKKAIPKVFFATYSKPAVTETELRSAFAAAVKGEKLVYYTGFLARDAETDPRVASLRKTVVGWHVAGRVTLVQKKLAEYSYEYYALVR